MMRVRLTLALLLAGWLYVAHGGVDGSLALVELLDPQFPHGPTDYYQFWAAVRDRWAGGSLYQHLPDTFPAHAADLGHTAPIRPADVLPVNAYPPLPNLLFVPLAGLPYSTGLIVWRYALVGCLAAAAGLLAWELVPGRWWRRLVVGAGGFVFLSGSAGAFHDVPQGNVGCLLLLLLVGAWAADRRGCRRLAGGLTAVATAVKLFPGLLFVFHLATDRRTFRNAVIGSAVLAGVSLAVFGWGEHTRFVSAAAGGRQWYARHYNHSVWGYWYRLFHDNRASTYGMTTKPPVEPWADAPAAARALSLAAAAAVLLPLGLVGWRRKVWSPAGRDAYFAATLMAMVLVSPVSWGGNTLLAAVPVGVLAAWRWRRTGEMLLLAGCAAVLWYHPLMWEDHLRPPGRPPYGPWESVTHLGFKTYALVGVYGLCLRATRGGSPLVGQAAPDSLSARAESGTA